MKRLIALVFVGMFGFAVAGCAHGNKNTKTTKTTEAHDAGAPVLHPPPAQ